MSTWPNSMPALAERVSQIPADRSVDEVVDRLTEIETRRGGRASSPGGGGGPPPRRERRPLPDGVACFNGMYLEVTRAARDALPSFDSRAFVERLGGLVGEFYFQAFAAGAADAWVSKAWGPLFERKDDRHVLALQFALAGMNAHINNDLAHALVLTWQEAGGEPGRDSPERRDYEKVNGLLERVERDIKGPLSDDLI